MGMNSTPMANRVHIGFFGRRNVGKSSLCNAITNQEIAIVSDTKGTTTDPVYKTMELLPLGPVVIIDTPGFDDEGELGLQRVKKTKQVLNKIDVAVLVFDGTQKPDEKELKLLQLFKEKDVPYVLVCNKMDLLSLEERKSFSDALQKKGEKPDRICFVNARDKEQIEEVKECLAATVKMQDSRFRIVSDLVSPMDVVILVVPIDGAAPKGRLILPQQQVLRDLLEAGVVSIVVKDTELEETIKKIGCTPTMVITDSQAFSSVSKIVPESIRLTSFSILMARWKGFLSTAVSGARSLENIEDGDKILIAEGCTHHRQCEDIGTVKLPRWICEYTGKQPQFDFCSGMEFPEDLSEYKLIVHCGACMLNEREVRYRMKNAVEQGIPFTNYGTAIAYVNGILERSIQGILDVK